jgi:hypothetical protein
MRPSPVLAVILLTLLAAGCDNGGKSAVPADPDWRVVAARDLNCADDKIEVLADHDDSDVNTDRTPDHIVTMRCVSADRAHPQPGQLEVFAGGSPVANPTRLGVLVRNWQHLQVSGCVAVTGGVIYAEVVDTQGLPRVWASHWTGSGTDRRLVGAPSTDWTQVSGCR